MNVDVRRERDGSWPVVRIDVKYMNIEAQEQEPGPVLGRDQRAPGLVQADRIGDLVGPDTRGNTGSHEPCRALDRKSEPRSTAYVGPSQSGYYAIECNGTLR